MKLVPTSTYRLQLHAGFNFQQAHGVTDYLHALGIGAVYTSPYLKAEHGSTHGYNVVDHSCLNPELGDERDYRTWTDGIAARGMLHILDIVPNHVGIGSGENAWWLDLLEHGPSSIYADYFDIEWRPPKPALHDRVLLPILGKQFGDALEAGELRVMRDGGRLFIAYYGHHLPAAPRSLVPLLERAVARTTLPANDPNLQELQSIVTALSNLPRIHEAAFESREARWRETQVIKRRLAAVFEASTELAQAVDGVLATFNGTVGDPQSFRDLETMLSNQHYRLSFWRVATEEINYRRFFDINELAALRMEDPRVYRDAHGLVLDLIRQKRVSGLRLDHTDGLYDPADYFESLHRSARLAMGEGRDAVIYLLIEKILEPGEHLPRLWKVSGTTGYDFLSAVNALWVNPEAEHKMTAFYRRFSGETDDFEEVAYESKRAIMRSSVASEILMLGQALERIAEANRRSRDFTRVALTTAIVETIACFPVYRSYIRPDGSRAPDDEGHIRSAIDAAKERAPHIDASVFDFLKDVLLLEMRLPKDDPLCASIVSFAMRFQQLCGPVMAKGVEDTALYRYVRLTSLNDVGCNPAFFGVSVADFHAQNEERLRDWPQTMLCTSTHDTKRGEDVRARISVLSEIPREWRRSVSAWAQRGRVYTTKVDGEVYPSRNDQYLFFQTVVGALPYEDDPDTMQRFRDRMLAYMTKATREAKRWTSWMTQRPAYEGPLARFITGMLGQTRFVSSLRELVNRIASHGATNSLAQLCLKMTAPGVPDTYQGGELWDFSLVDPDNRRPVDYNRSRELLGSLRPPSVELAAELVSSYRDGRIKLFVTHTALRYRRSMPDLFAGGSYTPLEAGAHVVAFERRSGRRRVVCIVPRLPLVRAEGREWLMGDVWGDDEIVLPEAGQLQNLFTGERLQGRNLALRTVLGVFPVALLGEED